MSVAAIESSTSATRAAMGNHDGPRTGEDYPVAAELHPNSLLPGH